MHDDVFARRHADAARQRAYRRRRRLGLILLPRLEIGSEAVSALTAAGLLTEFDPAAISRAVTRLLRDFAAAQRQASDFSGKSHAVTLPAPPPGATLPRHEQ